jgi:hypothetical protein
MKREKCCLVGLLLCLLMVLVVACFSSPGFGPAQAQSMLHNTVRLPGARLPGAGNSLSAQTAWRQPPSSSDVAPGPEAIERACDFLTNASPVFWDTPPQSGSLITLPSGQQITEPGPDDTVRVIIQLEGDPVSVYKSHLRASTAQFVQPEQDRMRAYDAALWEEHQQLLQQIQAQGITLQLGRQYTYIFNGLAASIQMADMERIAAMRGVRGVHPDYQVCASLDDSVPLIGADQVWSLLDPYGQPVTGQGMRVAVIDTGIDYTHPDLGGCFGPSCKVVGGYDFVNDDSDPMDDRGHGTHCAGIIAANGMVKGVAPDASLCAYKVLDEEGYGWSSDVIAGVERATDPDGDPGTDDAVDVMSISLGGSGNPDGPKALAVDAAVDQGVVVAVAVGNT